jgi:hypothetical protein
LEEVQPGAAVHCTDYPLGTVEEIITDPTTGKPKELVARHGSADYLLHVPTDLVVEASPGLVRLSVSLEDAETAVLAPADVPPKAGGIREGAPTNQEPLSEHVLGDQPGVLRTDPQTG